MQIVRFKKIKQAQCWWFGCPMPLVYSDPERTICAHCGELMSYESLAGMSRHSACKEQLRYWLFRKWLPAKCNDCGQRYKHTEACDRIPF